MTDGRQFRRPDTEGHPRKSKSVAGPKKAGRPRRSRGSTPYPPRAAVSRDPPLATQSRRTVLGVVLRRSLPDVWQSGGWVFQQAEGVYIGWGRLEWRAYSPAGVMTVHGSLRSAVLTMLRQVRAQAAQ